MDGAIKKFHKEGFIVISTKIGDVTIALPDSEEVEEGFELTIEDEDDNIAKEIVLKFD